MKAVPIAPSRTAEGHVIAARMKDVGHTQQTLAKVFVPRRSQTWVSQYLLADPARQVALLIVDDPENLARLAQALQWSVEKLIEASGATSFLRMLERPYQDASNKPNVRPLRGRLIPIVGIVNGGSKPVEVEGFIEVDSAYYRPGAVSLVVQGDSMTDPRDPDGEHSLREGDTVLVDPSLLEPMPGKLFVIELAGGGMVVKMADRLPNGEWWLRSYNEEAHPPFQWDEAAVKGMVYAKVPKPILLG